ncbi:MAG: hypothetical protein M3032_00050 [Verrucomicrobiota bacterium]|nr:hypothetical protein [Verrucomicrobiota bacterium]
MERIAENVWRLRYSLPLLGHDLGRAVTVIRLHSGKLVIHSTAPFSAIDIAAIRELGDPGWLLDATLFHDSFAKEGCRSFERVPYLAPPGFEKVAGVRTQPLTPPPAEWNDEIEVFPLAGMPKVQEHVLYHVPSRTLIVCDFFFNLGQDASAWTRFFFRYVMGLRRGIGMSFFFRLMIKDRAAFIESLRPILERNFARVIVGHGEVIEGDAQRTLREELAVRGLAPRR